LVQLKRPGSSQIGCCTTKAIPFDVGALCANIKYVNGLFGLYQAAKAGVRRRMTWAAL
jgi:hypothetical protein